MHYQISRNGQTYGPYTLEDLQRYLASGNVLPTDLCKSDEMPDWLPVSQVVAGLNTPAAPTEFTGSSYAEPTAPTAASTFSNPGYANPGYAVSDATYNPLANPAGIATSPYPDAPNLHWGLVLLFAFLTCSLFMWVWNIIVATWLKRVQPNATSLFYYAGAAALQVLQVAVFIPFAGVHHYGPGLHATNGGPLGGLIGLAVWVVRLIARFMQRGSLQEHFNGPEPVGLQLNPVMTFFFGGLYFQYHINRINQIKQAARYGQARAF